jgi:hypothetical protein
MALKGNNDTTYRYDTGTLWFSVTTIIGRLHCGIMRIDSPTTVGRRVHRGGGSHASSKNVTGTTEGELILGRVCWRKNRYSSYPF